jgi:hypothetical protein
MVGQSWVQNLSIIEANELKVQVYPNPTDNRVYVKGILSDAEMDLFSVEGRKISSFKLSSDSSYIDLNLPSGMYLMQIISEGKSSVQKIVIK